MLHLYRALRAAEELMQDSDLKLGNVLEKISEKGEITPKDLRGRSRRAYISSFREAAYYILRYKFGLSFPEIAHFIKRDHTTVMYGIERIEEGLKATRVLRAMDTLMRNDDLTLDGVVGKLCAEVGIAEEDFFSEDGTIDGQRRTYLRQAASYVFNRKFDLKCEDITALIKARNQKEVALGIKSIEDTYRKYTPFLV